mmetsp:Transcript_8801/g.24580  ORF Transcript_8801/g.24580 Transcript_8801/m.24580 type:complete len:106 (+) Transcript_8801:102-419(+)
MNEPTRICTFTSLLKKRPPYASIEKVGITAFLFTMLQFHTKTEIKPPRGFWLNLWGLSYIQLSMQLQAHQERKFVSPCVTAIEPPRSARSQPQGWPQAHGSPHQP